jgi:hypothetical protein
MPITPVYTALNKSIFYRHLLVMESTRDVYVNTHVRLYHSSFHSKQDEWVYTGLAGILAFGGRPGQLWFRLRDHADSARQLWTFDIPTEGFKYYLDRPFFHYFKGMVR